ncbi:putative reverse transcriptase zinc-binding domain-containing protein [Helianthus anomalus]
MVGEVGNGKDISFWLDRWAAAEPLNKIFPELFMIEAEKRCCVADRIRQLDGVQVLSWNWKSAVNEPGLVSRVVQLESLLHNTQVVDGCDKWKWTPDSDGLFSVKSVKTLLREATTSTSGHKVEWCKWIPSKINIHAWRADLDSIATGEALRKRNIQVGDSICRMCGSDEETVDHLFIGCYVASIIWNNISTWCSILNIYAFSFKDLLDFHSNIAGSEEKKTAVQGIIRIACWSIWKARNKLVFSNNPVKINNISSEIKASSFLWWSNRSKFKGMEWRDWCVLVNL